MKKIELLMTFAMIAAVVSCSRQETDINEVPDGFRTVVFSAAPETGGFSKTALSGDGQEKTVNWVKDDEIRIFYTGGSATAQAQAGGAKTTFSATVPQGDSYFAVYPSSAATFSDETFTVTIPAVQDGLFANGNVSVSRLYETEPSVFYNVTSFVKVVVNDADYSKVTVKAVGGEMIAGEMAVTLDSDDKPVPGVVANGTSEITLNVSAPGTYYVAVAPGVYFSKGILVNYFKGDVPSGSYFINGEFTIARSRIASVGALEERLGNIYVSVEGAGNKSGADWANAMSSEGFINLVGYEADHSAAVAKAAMLRGTTFRLASGVYSYNAMVELKCTQGSDMVSYTVDGGYYNGVKDAQNHPTEFSGMDEHTVFFIGENMDITFSDCQFTHSKGEAGNEAAVKLSHESARLTADNCVFRDNVNSSRAAGLGIANGYVVLNNCSFINNTASCGAAFTVDNKDAGGAVVMRGGLVKGNSCTGTEAAGAICNFGGVSLAVENVVFEDNVSVANGGAFQMIYEPVSTVFTGCTFGTEGHGNNAKHGGAVAVKGSSASATFDGCSFTANTASGDGGAVLANSSASLVFNGCSFSGNKGTKGGCFDVEANAAVTVGKKGDIVSTISGNNGSDGGAFNILTGGVVTLNDCTLSGNTASTKGGAVYLNGGTSKIYANGCTFTSNVASGKEGGAITAWASAKVYVSGGLFSGNKSKWGPAIELESSSRAEVTGNTVFSNNEASGPGGAMFVSGSTAVISGASFIGNSTATFGGAILAKNGTLEATGCVFKDNYSNGSTASNYGGAVCLGEKGSSTNGAILAKLNQCFFTGNHAYDGGAICMNDTGAKMYMNACAFYKDYCTESAGGATMYYNYGNAFHMNNCTVLDGTWNANGSSSINDAWFYFNRACKFTISNCTFIGDLRKVDGGAAQTDGGLLRFKNGNNTGYAINNIIAPKKENTYAAYIAGTFSCTSYYCKRAGNYGGTNWSSSSTDGYNAYASAFEGLTTHADASGTYADNYYSWDGTMTGIPSGSQVGKAQLSDVNSRISESDADFYSWLQSIGALDKDQLGHTRGTTTWPGAFDGTNL